MKQNLCHLSNLGYGAIDGHFCCFLLITGESQTFPDVKGMELYSISKDMTRLLKNIGMEDDITVIFT